MKIINSLVEYLEILKYIRKSEKVFLNEDIKYRCINFMLMVQNMLIVKKSI